MHQTKKREVLRRSHSCLISEWNEWDAQTVMSWGTKKYLAVTARHISAGFTMNPYGTWWEMTNASGRPAGLWCLMLEWLKYLSGLIGGLSVKAIYSKPNGCLLRTTVIVSSELIKTSVNWQLRKGLLHRHTKYFVNRLKKWVVCAGLSVFILPKSTNCNFGYIKTYPNMSSKEESRLFKMFIVTEPLMTCHLQSI